MLTIKEKKSLSEKYTTGKGELTGYINLFEPSTKFNKEGVYQAHLLISKEEGISLREKLKRISHEQYKEYGSGTIEAEITQCVPYTKVNELTNEEEQDINERYIVKAKAGAFIKNGRITQRIQVLDSKLKPIDNLKVKEGTIARLGLELTGYSYGGKTGVSIKLRLVQIIKLAEYTNSYPIQSYGLKEEDGFDFIETKENTILQNEEIEEEADF